MKKKIYNTPLTEVEKIYLGVSVLAGSPPNEGSELPIPPTGPSGIVRRRGTDVF